MPHVSLVRYGETYEGRPLIAAIIAHPDNKQSIENIRKNHLASSGLIEQDTKKSEYAIVWLVIQFMVTNLALWKLRSRLYTLLQI